MLRHNLITGGAGFIGTNLADRLLARGETVAVLDSLTRPGSERNAAWLRARYPADRLSIVLGDVRDADTVATAASTADCIFHLAGQVAVTTSLADPRADFESNAAGTLNALEAARHSSRAPIFLYASTNKVYGDLETVGIREEPTRHALVDLPHGIPETQPLDFRSPYGCSKGAGDQYVLDYHRSFGVRAVVLRQSCIYGPHQSGAEDQGWVAWFVIAALQRRPITIYGDGKQVRDLLFVDDLLDAYDAAVAEIDRAAGHVYNIGGGPERALAVWAEFGPLLEEVLGYTIPVASGRARTGDQRVYISDIRKAQRELGWRPKIAIRDGLARLVDWVQAQSPPVRGG